MRDEFTFTETRVLLAVIAECAEQGRATVRSVAARAGLSVSYTHTMLVRLWGESLVDYDAGKRGVLRPLVRPVRRAA